MYTTLFVILGLTFLALVIQHFMQNQRQIHKNEMRVVYQKMEIFVYQNRLQNKADVVRFLAPLNFFIQNCDSPQFYEITKAIDRLTPDQYSSLQKKVDVIDEHVPQELKDLEVTFHEHFRTVIKYPKKGLFFCLVIVFVLLVFLLLSMFKGGSDSVKSVIRRLTGSIRPESAILTARLGFT